MLQRAGLNVDQLLAVTIAAAIVFVIANLFPVLRITLDGVDRETTLFGSVLSLSNSGSAPMAVIVALAIIVVPALQIAMLAWLLWFARDG